MCMAADAADLRHAGGLQVSLNSMCNEQSLPLRQPSLEVAVVLTHSKAVEHLG